MTTDTVEPAVFGHHDGSVLPDPESHKYSRGQKWRWPAKSPVLKSSVLVSWINFEKFSNYWEKTKVECSSTKVKVTKS